MCSLGSQSGFHHTRDLRRVKGVVGVIGALNLLAYTRHLFGGRHGCDNNRAEEAIELRVRDLGRVGDVVRLISALDLAP